MIKPFDFKVLAKDTEKGPTVEFHLPEGETSVMSLWHTIHWFYKMRNTHCLKIIVELSDNPAEV